MAIAKQGDKVRINFTGTLEDGTIFDTTLKDTGCCDDDDCGCGDDGCDDDSCGCGGETGPMEITIGNEDFFPQIEAALVGMAPGEKKTVVIPAEDAFGEYDEDEVFAISREQLTGDIVPEVGMELELTGDDDEPVDVVVVEVNETSIVVDANHPLAGEDISYEVELVEIL
ncbi:FKBP-type peptidyl-prolyl cis-trans isomerase [Geomonas subterranea]|uniref:Peptidyl-prolyl cis-trans isomerase n=1 Tax=Geomonas subterranea TaxID=2847989 RepID=A0ABX8LH16_9BACT|nr:MULTISPECIES: FKBP-type peptidyl-prolyl cis-trans isomerase [Geomonas]QXE89984.1 FKBP-type peptidyl-prolyl cis-trans isomerase [Geomonas subterranea]QXM07896.1 FKBP-type peptidyl-prolyl cis-trans isomerase [Geomonas subterranea]